MLRPHYGSGLKAEKQGQLARMLMQLSLWPRFQPRFSFPSTFASIGVEQERVAAGERGGDEEAGRADAAHRALDHESGPPRHRGVRGAARVLLHAGAHICSPYTGFRAVYDIMYLLSRGKQSAARLLLAGASY